MTHTDHRPARLAGLFFLFLLTLLGAAAPAGAGTISLQWDPVTDLDLAGYRVYYGTAPNTYSQNVDVGNVTSTTLSGLSDCTTWYVAVKAYDTSGNLSTSYSNEVSGWPRPVVSSTSPASAEQGLNLDVVINGSNFQSGAVVTFGVPGVVVSSVVINSCTKATAKVSVGPSATVGATNVEVTNPDQVFGTGTGVFAVQGAVPPSVSSTSPADAATGVSTSVKPTVTFSEAMLPSSITSSTVKLLDSSGSAVAQAAGSPALSSDGLTATLTPASALANNTTYKMQVLGGGTGVSDLASHPMSSTYTQGTGFRTVGDTGAPTISAVAASNVGPTTARITWTTNEASDSQVFYRKSGQSAYQQTAVDSAPVTSHTVDLQGLEPSKTYEFHVRSADATANASTSSPDQTFVTSASSFTFLRFEAEAGDKTAPVRSTSGSAVFGGAWLDTPIGTPTGTETSPSGTATFGFNVPYSGTWKLWVRMYGPTTSADSWFESVNGATRQAITAPQTGAWIWVAGRSYTLPAGLSTLEIGGREAQAGMDRVLLTDDPAFVPTEQAVGDMTPTNPVAPFTSSSASQQVTLSWNNPSNSDFSKTVVRYRTDGKYPVSPVDGIGVTEKAAAPSSADSFVHTGLTNGTTYSYSAFAVDTSGNVSAKTTSQATPPSGNLPPGQVKNVHRKDKKLAP